jgi:acylphosphatase
MAPELSAEHPGGRVAREIVAHGRVQGVFFRASIRDAARRAGVAGWATNRPDGTVAIRLEGEPSAVASVERACEQGPDGARVESVDRRDVASEGLRGFSVG